MPENKEFPEDVLGTTIRPGVVITYATRRGSQMELRVAVVRSVVKLPPRYRGDYQWKINVDAKFPYFSAYDGKWVASDVFRNVVLHKIKYITVVLETPPEAVMGL